MGDFQGKSVGRDGATNSKIRITLDPDAGDILIGGNGRGGDLKVNDDQGSLKIRLDAGGVEANLPESTTESILLAGSSGTITAASLILTNNTLSGGGELSVGSQGVNDFVVLKNKESEPRINL